MFGSRTVYSCAEPLPPPPHGVCFFVYAPISSLARTSLSDVKGNRKIWRRISLCLSFPRMVFSSNQSVQTIKWETDNYGNSRHGHSLSTLISASERANRKTTEIDWNIDIFCPVPPSVKESVLANSYKGAAFALSCPFIALWVRPLGEKRKTLHG